MIQKYVVNLTYTIQGFSSISRQFFRRKKEFADKKLVWGTCGKKLLNFSCTIKKKLYFCSPNFERNI